MNSELDNQAENLCNSPARVQTADLRMRTVQFKDDVIIMLERVSNHTTAVSPKLRALHLYSSSILGQMFMDTESTC